MQTDPDSVQLLFDINL